TPDHTPAMREALAGEWNARGRGTSSVITIEAPAPAAEGEAAPRTLRQKLADGEFVVSVELDPPRGLNPRKVLEGATQLKALGVDCINIGDSPMARVRMSAVALAVLMKQRVGVEP